MSLFFTARINKEGGIKKSFGRQKMLGTAKPSGVILDVYKRQVWKGCKKQPVRQQAWHIPKRWSAAYRHTGRNICRAIRIVREHAGEWNIHPRKIGDRLV